jgi:DNA-binding GntR family transcriptional regulator
MKAQAEDVSALTREEEQAEVIRRLEEDIIFGRFAPGSRLVEDTLMTRYGASRHFVRQGLFQLERQGIVLREKNIGATVRFYSAEEVRHIYEVREMLTRQAALMIALPARGPTRRICAAFTRPTTPSTSRCSRPAAIPTWCVRCRTT